MKTVLFPALCLTSTLVISLALAEENDDQANLPSSKASQQAVEQARRTVAILDDFAAGSAAVLLFKNISDSGSHTVRLIDATGEPHNPENIAQDDFERKGLQQLKDGKQTYDRIESHAGQHFLRTMTPVPAVMERCIMCHDHYADVKEGEPIGAISYTIPIEEE